MMGKESENQVWDALSYKLDYELNLTSQSRKQLVRGGKVVLIQCFALTVRTAFR